MRWSAILFMAAAAVLAAAPAPAARAGCTPGITLLLGGTLSGSFSC